MKYYIFDVELAKKFGVEEAIMIENFRFWITKNKANNTNFHDGRYWTYNSMSAFQKLFPFWTLNQIRRILDSLISKGVIIKGNYNKSTYDRTIWYAFVDEEKHISICENSQMDLSKNPNGFEQNHTPIPDNIPDNIPDKLTTFILSANLQNSPSTPTASIATKEKNTPEKKQYLDHVYLTEPQYDELVSRFGQEGADDYIGRLNSYIHQIGKRKADAKYKSHYHVILNWYNMEQKELMRRVAVREAVKQKEEEKYAW